MYASKALLPAVRTLSYNYKNDIPKLVSRQFRAETSAVCLASSVFCFNHPAVFRAFVLSARLVVTRVRRVSLFMSIFPTKPMFWSAVNWAKALTNDLTGLLFNLEGVELRTPFLPGRKILEHNVEDSLLCSAWIRCGMTDIIKFFQQHKLKKDLTSFKPSYSGIPVNVPSHPDRAWLVEAVHKHLLDYQGTP